MDLAAGRSQLSGLMSTILKRRQGFVEPRFAVLGVLVIQLNVAAVLVLPDMMLWEALEHGLGLRFETLAGLLAISLSGLAGGLMLPLLSGSVERLGMWIVTSVPITVVTIALRIRPFDMWNPLLLRRTPAHPLVALPVAALGAVAGVEWGLRLVKSHKRTLDKTRLLVWLTLWSFVTLCAYLVGALFLTVLVVS